jgi:predicted XRE-type DNA-binding protein
VQLCLNGYIRDGATSSGATRDEEHGPRKADVHPSSGSVFEDLRVDGAAEALAKSQLAALIAQALRERGLTQTSCAKLLGIDQPKVSELMRGRLTRFSTERFLTFLTRLGRDVEIVVRETSDAQRRRAGRLLVRAASASRRTRIRA